MTVDIRANIHVNSFVKRQTPESAFSYFDGSWEELRQLVTQRAEATLRGEGDYLTRGYRDGVALVTVPPERFFSGVVQLEEGDTVQGQYVARREGEAPRLRLVALGKNKLPAKAVEIVLYSSAVLAEDGDNELPVEEGNWEIISINARPTEGPQPMRVGTLLANHFRDDGGTATNMTPEELVEALREAYFYWKGKALAGGSE